VTGAESLPAAAVRPAGCTTSAPAWPA